MDGLQCRMARAALGWALDDLAKAAGINKRTIMRHESGETVMPENVTKLRQSLESEGVVFIERGAYLGGVVPPKEGR
jgi:DNA-binding XRE family transcriptional regulator